jgi:uncharacterized radical SAM superfamily Fe-S cluster-containing enzyme
MRFTVGDLARCVEEQTGLVKSNHDWMPLACINPFIKLHEALTGKLTTKYTCNPHCSIGTYLFIDDEGKATSMFDFLDFKNMLIYLDKRSKEVEKSYFTSIAKFKTWFELKKFFNEEKAPKGLTFSRLLECLDGYRDKEHGKLGKNYKGEGYKMMFVAAMHFQDNYNFDLNRIKRCVIHYSAADGKIYPFCTYNAGPTYRETIEKKCSVSFSEYKNHFNDSCATTCGI